MGFWLLRDLPNSLRWLKPSNRPPFDRPIWASTNLPGWTGSAPVRRHLSCRPTCISGFRTAFFTRHGRAWSLESLSVSESSAGVSVQPDPPESTVLCAGVDQAQRRALAGSARPVQLGRRRMWRDLHAGLNADPFSGRVAGPAQTGSRRRGAFFPKGRFVTWMSFGSRRQDLGWAPVRRSVAPPYQVQMLALAGGKEAWSGQRPSILLAGWRALGPCWRIQNPPLPAWIIRASTLGHCSSKVCWSPRSRSCPLCTVAEALLFPFLAGPRTRSKACNGVALSIPR